MPTARIDQLLNALAWMLLHSLWQGAVVAVLAGLGLWLMRGASAAARYRLLAALLILFAGGTVFTFWLQWVAAGHSLSPVQAATVPGDGPPVASLFPAAWLSNTIAFLNAASPLLVGAWGAVLFVKSLRMVREVRLVRALRTTGTGPAGSALMATLAALAAALGVRKPVALLESAAVKVPVVVGYLKPLILLPLGMAGGLPAGELEAILLHELAHVRRHDHLVNYLQRAAELLFFFNPGLLWISALLRTEREHCCDDMAVAYTGDKRQFVEALVRCREYSLGTPGYALGWPGQRHGLLHRATRLVSGGSQSLPGGSRGFLALNGLALALLLLGSAQGGPVSGELAAGLTRATPASLPRDQDIPAQHLGREKEDKDAGNGSQHGRSGNTLGVARSVRKARTGRLRPTLLPKPPLPPLAGAQQSPVASATATACAGFSGRTGTATSDAVAQQRLQLEKDREQAERDREQAAKDRTQAALDRAQAERDREQAARDRLQAEKDRAQAERDRQAFRSYSRGEKALPE